MPKLLQINSCINRSTGRIAQQLGETAIDAGWESWIAYSARSECVPSKSNLIKIGSQFDARVHAFQTRLLDNHGLCSGASTRQLIQDIQDVEPDVIHLHNIHGYYLNYEVLFNFLASYGRPVVWTIHDCWAFTGHCVHYTDVDCYKWKEASDEHCSNCPKLRDYPTSYLFDRSSRNYAQKRCAFTSVDNLTLVPVSYWLGDVLKESFLGSYPIKVIQNGVDLNTFYPREGMKFRKKHHIEDKYIVLGVATGWSENVGLSDFIRLSQVLDERFKVVMVGTTPAIDKMLPKNIISVNRTNDVNELAQIYSEADILFNGSFMETFGLVTAEAISCGTPALVYNSTACPEIVTKDTGYVVSPKDFDAVVTTLMEDINVPSEYRQKRKNTCREYAFKQFDRNKKYALYMEIYNSVIQTLGGGNFPI